MHPLVSLLDSKLITWVWPSSVSLYANLRQATQWVPLTSQPRDITMHILLHFPLMKSGKSLYRASQEAAERPNLSHITLEIFCSSLLLSAETTIFFNFHFCRVVQRMTTNRHCPGFSLKENSWPCPAHLQYVFPFSPSKNITTDRGQYMEPEVNSDNFFICVLQMRCS